MNRTTFGLALMLTFASISWDASAQSDCTVHQSQEQRRAEARQRFQRGQELFEANEFNSAMSNFECSFQNVPHPSTLYNIARTAELLGQFGRALDAWRGYLQMSPDAEDRAEIEERIRGLEAAAANSASSTPVQQGTTQPTNQAATQQAWTQQTLTPAQAPTSWETPENAPTNVYTPGADGQPVQMVERRPPSPWRQYAWYIFGGGAALALVGLVLATPIIAAASTSEGGTVCVHRDYYNEDGTINNDYDGYMVTPGCWIAGVALLGAGATAMLASIFVWAFAERGGEYVVTRQAGFTPTLAMTPEGEVTGFAGNFVLRF